MGSFITWHWLVNALFIVHNEIPFTSAGFNRFNGSIGCPPMQFLCLDGECISEEKHCNGMADCVDGTDELDCEVLKCLPPNYFTCENQRCVSSRFLCDDDNDCEDWSDEKNCSNHILQVDKQQSTCSPREFQCLDRLCVPEQWVCDGKSDCLDGSDESLGCTLNIECDGFKCQNHFCIPKEFRCDGANDCGDHSDELNCPRREFSQEDCSLDHRMFRCTDGIMCIELFEVCNGHENCLDNSDEGGLCQEDLCSNSSCLQECHRSPKGPLCTCAQGHFNDGHACVDINECEHFGICDHKCTNTKGSYECSCDPGYRLSTDRRTCKAEGPEGLLLFSTHKQVRGYFLTSQVYFPVSSKDLTHVTGVAYDGLHVYWTNIYEGQESIARALEDGSDEEIILTAGLGTPEDLALDWITKNIYFTDSKYQQVGVCSNDGRLCTVLHNKDIDKPRGICLAPAEGLMYWSDWGKKALIARAGMDGSDVTEFITKDIHWPNGLTIDHGNQRLYWVDAKLLVIESVRLDGTDRKVVLSEAIKHPYAIAVFENSIYWSDWSGKDIQKCNKFTGKDRETVIREKNNNILGIHIYHPAMMNSSSGNPCSNAGCSDLCLLAPHTRPLPYSCACPQDKALAPDTHFCEQILKAHSLVVGAGATLLEIGHQRLGKVIPKHIPMKNVYKIGALAYDALSGNIVIVDSAEKKIVTLDRLSGQTTVVLSGNVGKVEGLDVDPYGHNLYWVDSERQTVEVLSLNTHERKVLLDNLGGESPLDVAVVPDEGYMFVALMGPMTVHIDRFNMDGDPKSRVHIVDNHILGPNVALAWDRLNHIFWVDSGSGSIQGVDVDGMKRFKIRELYHSPIDVAVIEDDIFWTSHGTDKLLWVKKYEKEEDSSKQIELGLTAGLESLRLAAVTGQVAGHEHTCQLNNGGCSHICLVVPHTQVCTCPFGMVLRPDGRTCEIPEHCQVGQFRCSSGECIPVSLRCNRHPDCPRGEDELGCTNYTLNCPRDMFSCHDGEKCLEHSNRCDGISNCMDGSDELNCLQSATCRPGEYQCKSGPCVPMSWRCDDTKDCEDGSDEEQCEKATCQPDKEFRCTSGTCIPSNWECDGHPDCNDGSDEHEQCLTTLSCLPDQLTCHNGHCVDHQLKCNGQDDCEDGTDERGCPPSSKGKGGEPVHVTADTDTVAQPLRPHCQETEFTCDVCLPAGARCNGTAECKRGEDETDCDGCHSHQFQCVGSGRCILLEWKCDGANDCGDNSDEDPSLCIKGAVKIPGYSGPSECGEFTCKNLQCLPFHKVCDGKIDCEDNSDEGGRCGRGCVGAGCMDICHETPSGPRCACSPGYQLLGDSKRCTDIDECKLGIYCSQFCHNTQGKFQCNCQYPDYQLRDDRMTCKAKGHEMQMVYVLDNEIRYVTSSHSSLGVVHVSPNPNFQVSGLDVDSRKRCIYWSSALVGTITRKCLATKNSTEIISKLARPEKLVLDWLTENVYFVERKHIFRVSVCHFGVRRCAVVVNAGPDASIDTLAIDPIRKLMFWSESTTFGLTKSVIKRADLTGASVSVVLDEGLHWLSDMALDSLHQKLYWLDTDRKQVERISYNGTDKQSIFSSPDVPVKLALFENSVYWMVAARSSVRRQYLDTHGNLWKCAVSGPAAWHCDQLKIHPRNTLAAPSNFAIMQEALQPLGSSGCEAQCSYLCVTGGACLCPNGTRVRPGATCPDMPSATKPVFKVVPTPSAESSFTWTLLKVVLLTFIVLPIIVSILFVLRYDIMVLAHSCFNATNKSVFSNLQFNNPGYDTNPTHVEAVFHHSRLNPGEHQYENPMVFDNLSDETASTITNEITPKKQKVVEFRVSDLGDEDSESLEYSEPMGESHKTPLIR